MKFLYFIIPVTLREEGYNSFVAYKLYIFLININTRVYIVDKTNLFVYTLV